MVADRLTVAWVAQLDVDLERAQQVLRSPRATWPVPPGGLPPVWGETWEGEPVELEPAVPDPAAAPVRRLGAYGRRRGL